MSIPHVYGMCTCTQVKDHMNGLPVVDVKYHARSGQVVSADRKAIKVWEPTSGKTYTTIQPAAEINDVAVYSDSGMLFAALETERLGACTARLERAHPVRARARVHALMRVAWAWRVRGTCAQARTLCPRSGRRRAGATSSTR